MHLIHQEDPEAEEQQERQDVDQHREDASTTGALDGDGHVVLVELVQQALLGARRVTRVELLPAFLARGGLGLGHLEGVVLGLDVDLGNLALLDLLEELVVGGRLRSGIGTDHTLGDEGQHDDQQDRECGALEKPLQIFLSELLSDLPGKSGQMARKAA